MPDRKQYLSDPCRTSSIPYWKALSISVPSNMTILHHSLFEAGIYDDYIDEPYFRLMHDLRDIPMPVLPVGYRVCKATVGEFSAHICACYASNCMTKEQLRCYMTRDVYDEALWIAIRDEKTGQIVATGIAELDSSIGEGVLEWIQVSKEHQRRGLGRFVVAELLRRMENRAKFATVSGKCNHPDCPEALYRSCGFTGHDVWHILRRKENR